MVIARRTQNAERRPKNNYGRIGVLMGGPSTEREISLKSGRAVFEALQNLGLDAVAVDIQTDDFSQNSRLLRTEGIQSAFIALHGRFGEDGQIQEILDSLKIPYTGSGKLASRLAMDKLATRRILEVYGFPIARYAVIEKAVHNPNTSCLGEFTFPVVVKPASHGSSIGLSIVEEKKALSQAIESALNFDEKVIVEEYIKGREMTVGVLDDRALPVIEVIPKNRFFDYQAKYTAGLTEYMVPAKIDRSTARRIQDVALKVHRLLGCYAYSRVDIILSEKDVAYVLEVNTIPGFTQTSLFPKAARVVGIDFSQLCLELIRLAHEKA